MAVGPLDDWEAAFAGLASLIERRYGLSRRLQRDRLQAFFAERPGLDRLGLTERLSRAPDGDPLCQTLVEAMLVHETFFYRHPDQLDVMVREVLPALRERRGEPLRVWCAGCATGEEAYTLAFLLRDAGCAGRVIATDLSPASLAEARAGLYRRKPGLNSFRALPEHARRHFEPHPTEPDCWAVAPAIRRMVDFEPHNLMTPLTSGLPVDLISCRNTLIYFSEKSLRQVESMLVAAARPGTALLLGPAERLRYTNVFVPLTEAHPQILHWPLPGAV
jgi:chemotaxis protein methyltransferase CheR